MTTWQIALRILGRVIAFALGGAVVGCFIGTFAGGVFGATLGLIFFGKDLFLIVLYGCGLGVQLGAVVGVIAGALAFAVAALLQSASANLMLAFWKATRSAFLLSFGGATLGIIAGTISKALLPHMWEGLGTAIPSLCTEEDYLLGLCLASLSVSSPVQF